MNQFKSLHSPLVKPIFKRSGITPLQAINKFKATYPEFQNETISYAGRLDPMAEGLLLLLIGEVNKQRSSFLQLPKTYIVDILFGIATDSFDVLGIVENIKHTTVKEDSIKKILSQFEGRFMQKFPPFSSKPVSGKPLYYWAYHNRLNEVEIPEKERTITSISLERISEMPGRDVIQNILERIAHVEGDFRQESIAKTWEKHKKEIEGAVFTVAKISIEGSSGLYMRQLAVDIGEKLHCPAMAYRIVRTKIGSFSLHERPL